MFKPLQYGCLWTPLDPTKPLVPVPRYFYGTLRYFYGTLRYFYGTFWYFNLILKAVKEPSEPERGAEAHEVRRSAELHQKVV